MTKYWCCKADFGEHEDDCPNKINKFDGLLDRLTECVLHLATCKKHDPSWMRPMKLTQEKLKFEYDEAMAIIEELRNNQGCQE